MEFSLCSFYAILVFLLLEVGNILAGGASNDPTSFDAKYYVTWGNNNVLFLNQGAEIQLSMDKSSGAGFASKLSYGSGFFHLRIKLPDKDSAGVVTAFYLTSHTDDHDELDFEFLGNREGRPYTLQTNVFSNGQGNREQRMHLWFDPTADFHDYQILWNQHQIVSVPAAAVRQRMQALSGMIGHKASVGGFLSPPSNPRAQPWTGGGNCQALSLLLDVTIAPENPVLLPFDIESRCRSHRDNLIRKRFYVDNIPFRVFKNNTSIGVSYPTQPMQIEASLWDGDSWATDGGQTKINWSHAPFKAHFQGFNIDGCPTQQGSDLLKCYSSNLWWNQQKYWKLDSKQQEAFDNVRNNYMNYDYCSDRARYPNPPPECLQ